MERDRLMEKLVEVEMDGRAASEHVTLLKNQLRSYEEVRPIPKQHHSQAPQTHRQLFLSEIVHVASQYVLSLLLAPVIG